MKTMPRKMLNYDFHHVGACEMCGQSTQTARVLGMRLNRSQGRKPRAVSGIAVSVLRCRECGLIFSQPQPRPSSIDDHYGIPPEEYWTNVNFEPGKDYFAWETETAKDLLDFKPGMKAIDVGVGLGKAMRVMRAQGFDVYGFEPSRPFYEKTRDLVGADEEHLKHASMEEVEFEDGAFDFVTFGAVLEHLYAPSFCLEKAMRWLRPGGIVHAEIPSSDYLLSKVINFYNTLRFTNYVTNISPMHPPFHLYEFTLDCFQKHGEIFGYRVERHDRFVGPAFAVPRFLHEPLRRYMRRTGTGMQLTVWLRKL